MKNRWNTADFEAIEKDLLQQRVYSSRLLGAEPNLVLHGGGNTSVKLKEVNAFGEEEEILYVKGSGWDLASIEKEGFAPVKQAVLLKMAEFDQLSDTEMVRLQRTAMTNPDAPNPSVEAILHAIIPFKFVDHTHADAVVTISNTPDGLQRIQSIYKERVLIVPYVMPGFILAKAVYEMTKSIDWSQIDALILMHHGVFTFHDTAAQSYAKMIEIVQMAEDYLQGQNIQQLPETNAGSYDTMQLAQLRKAISQQRGAAVLAQIDTGSASRSFSSMDNLSDIANRGPLTPDHIIRTKRTPLLIEDDSATALDDFVHQYAAYFDRFKKAGLQCLDKAPRWALLKNTGAIYFGRSTKEIQIIGDIAKHTMQAIHQAEQMGGWKALSQQDLFDMEYWELEQLKLKKNKSAASMQGKIALVTGAASGIGKATVEALLREGAVVMALDIQEKVMGLFDQQRVLPFCFDIRDDAALQACIQAGVAHFGGLDYLVLNAGIFPASNTIAQMPPTIWEDSLHINLTAPQRLLKYCQPYLEWGIESAVVIVGSKNVPAPGKAAAAYSVAKAGLTQLGRIAALEMGPKGIRVNILHPNAVFDTAIWSDEILKSRAKHYNMTVDAYKKNNLLKVSITSKDVAKVVLTMLGDVFSKITGAQLPIDGGNERVI